MEQHIEDEEEGMEELDLMTTVRGDVCPVQVVVVVVGVDTVEER